MLYPLIVCAFISIPKAHIIIIHKTIVCCSSKIHYKDETQNEAHDIVVFSRVAIHLNGY